MLTPEQLQHIERYIADRKVRWYDVQVELTDHLAALVEQSMQDRGIGFIEALGEQGPIFAQDWPVIIHYKTRYARRKILKTFGQEFLRFFRWPKLALSVAVIAAMPVVAVTGIYSVNDLWSVALLFEVIRLFYLRRSWRKYVGTNMMNPYTKTRLLFGRQLWMISNNILWVTSAFLLFTIIDYKYLSPGWSAPPTLLNSVLFYTMPLFLFFQLAWRKTCIDLNQALREDYPNVLENKSIMEILVEYKKRQHA
jgi:hypothetical protein